MMDDVEKAVFEALVEHTGELSGRPTITREFVKQVLSSAIVTIPPPSEAAVTTIMASKDGRPERVRVVHYSPKAAAKALLDAAHAADASHPLFVGIALTSMFFALK